MQKTEKAKIEEQLKEAKKRRPSPINDLLMTISVGAMATGILGSVILGGMKKMFGTGNEIKVRDAVVGIIDGFMVYIQEKDEKIKELDKKLSEKEEEMRSKERQYNEVLGSLDKMHKELKEWRRRYMKMIKKSKPKKK